ncbi:DUF1156 domain-containing protein [Desulfobacca acetoxidans]|uniref:DUF1156 domain-containing protein n=1 Tax=Desulfobacca acetoxidans (strain ATCC 700848 / DSM 11109 / ASRB2) TaxID=880072 RepID=F2NHL5_DESAR|nr:DUF1156 domain-containing protein [Desulfobacca acetoxidans]AEB09202.1 protein of unknown function DUF1156 [Desulfobacca acetoxidans DSM 11109]
MNFSDKRLIEHGFPCHQVGAETQRERGASSALPPLYYLHVWWARRPLTPSRAAILASLLPADTDPERFIRRLGIEKVQVLVRGQAWTLTGGLLGKIQRDGAGREFLAVDAAVVRALARENQQRLENRALIAQLQAKDPGIASDPVVQRWHRESQPLANLWPEEGEELPVQRVMGDPAWYKQLLAICKVYNTRIPNLYGYDRAFANPTNPTDLEPRDIIILDPTAGGGSIPFEALRLGYKVFANELNAIAATILYGTLDYPAKYGIGLLDKIENYGKILLEALDDQLSNIFPKIGKLPKQEKNELENYLWHCPEYSLKFDKEEVTTFLYTRQVTCPHCRGEAPLLNSCWLSKEAGDAWGVQVIPDGSLKQGRVRFATYRVQKGKGPNGEDPNLATVKDAVGTCVHCRQAIDGDEIKAQARGESPLGQWQDRLYCVVAQRLEPVLDKTGQPVRYASGGKKGEIKTRKVRFFRPPNEGDLEALKEAERRLREKWPRWEAQGLIPTEKFPEGNDNRPISYGMPRWCDMFTPRQLLGHLTLVEGLNALKPQIIEALGFEKGRAVVTYLQFAIDKGVDYNSRQTRWEYTRGIVKGNFGRHDFSLKWTFGEMIFTGPNSGASWGLSQVLDAYAGIAALVEPVHRHNSNSLPLTILHGTAAHMPQVPDRSVDLVCMDPPYYNNVQYAELSDYFYVWQKRTLKDLYPELFNRRLTNKQEEAVANPARDGSAKGAKTAYERMMGEIFAECRRVLKDEGLLTLMFTHKSQDAWEALIRSLIESGWIISASFPVESEAAESMHQKNLSSAASSIFLSCRKREEEPALPAMWTGLGGQGVQVQIRQAVEAGLQEFAPLQLNPVDQMVACYGRALRVLSEQWPVMDGDEPVSPLRAMNEASRVVAEHQIGRLTEGRLSVDDLDPETALGLTAFGIWGLHDFAFDEALNLSKSLNIALVTKAGGYRLEGRMAGVNQETAAGRAKRPRGQEHQEASGYSAPLVKKGSKLRLAQPEERSPQRLADPLTDWDVVQGVVMAYRQGDIPLVRDYLDRRAADKKGKIKDLLQVWAAEVDDQALRQEGEAILFGLR